MRVFGIAGWKNAGKTGLVERLVSEITGRGFTVSTLKHAHHSFDVDHPGKDSYRHRAAGAEEVLLAAHTRWALMAELRGRPEPELEDHLARLAPVDLVLVEGYKRSGHAKVEAFRAETGNALIAPGDDTIRAVASDVAQPHLSVPVFDLNDTAAIADFILQEVGLAPSDDAGAPPLSVLVPPKLKNDCFALPPGVDWTPVDDALGHLERRLTAVVGAEDIAVAASVGRVLAEDQIARRSNPPAANSAVDGYGFAQAATGAGAQVLPLVPGRAAAGAPFGGSVPEGQALRILTGALLPPGVDTVVLEEDVNASASHVAFEGPVKPGANTRRAGEDMQAGDVALKAGHMLRPPDLALLSALGIARINVRRVLRIGVLSTGDELSAPGSTKDSARTYDANRPMLMSLAQRWGYLPVDLGHAPDDRAALRAALDSAAGQVDVILSSGGASAGDEDHMSALLSESGALQDWRIAMKPGRPLALGLWQGVPIFGLPGNPVAAFVCALVFARPACLVLAGAQWAEPQAFQVPAAFEKRKKAGRREYLRARIGADGRAEVFASEGSGRISGLSWAGGLVELPDEADHIQPGDMVTYLPYGSFGI